MRAVRRFFGAVLLATLGFPGTAEARLPCHAGVYLDLHKAAVADMQRGDFAMAVTTFGALAEVGFPPSQARLAYAHLLGKGVRKDQERALFWALLAAREGDANGRGFAKKIGRDLSDAVRARVKKKADAWSADISACSGEKAGKIERLSAHEGMVNGGTKISISRAIPEKIASRLSDDLYRLLNKVSSAMPKTLAYYALIDELHVFKVSEDPYDRYVGWDVRSPGNVLLISYAHVLDQSSKFLIHAINLEVKRRIYDSLPKSKYRDPLIRVHRGTKLVGSVYDDVKNDKFYKMAAKALDMAGRLPNRVRRAVEAIDIIRYNPQSKHFRKTGRVDALGAYVLKEVGGDGARVITLRREARWASPATWLLSIVHEGTHILQQEKAESFETAVSRGDGTGEMKAYLQRWRVGVKKGGRHVDDIRFECEATENEILAARALDLPPSLIEESGYLHLCDKAQKMMVSWSDDRMRKRKKK